jgi:hypothetical protein
VEEVLMSEIHLLEDSVFLAGTEYEFTPGRMVESKGHQLHILGTIHGKMGHAGVPTGNNRRYPTKIVNENISRLLPAIKARGVFGEADHPSDGRTKLQRVSHIVTSAKLESNGILNGTWDILDTPNGRIVQAVCKAGGRLGASTRGRGSTSMGGDGVEDVNPDYKMITIDAVVDPAAKDSYPKLVAEAQSLDQLEEMVLDYEYMSKEYPGLTEELVVKVLEEHKDKIRVQVPAEFEGYEDAVAVVRTEFAEKLESQKKDLAQITLDSMEQFREDVADEERGKLMRTLDPVKDRVALEDISRVLVRRGILLTDEQRVRLADLEQAVKDAQGEKDTIKAKMEELQEQTDILASLGTKASMTLVAERMLGGKSYRQAVLDVMGDFSQYKTKEEFGKAIDSAIRQFEANEQATDDLKGESNAKALEQERKEHRESLSRLEQSLGDVETAHTEEIDELNSRHETEVAEFQAEIESWKGRYDEERKRTEKLTSDVQEAIREGQRISKLALADEKKYEDAIRELKGRNEGLREEAERSELKFKIEKMLSGRPDADRLRPMVENADDEEEAASIIAAAVTATPPESISEDGRHDDKPQPRGVQDVEITDEQKMSSVDGTSEFHEEMESLGVDPSDVLS